MKANKKGISLIVLVITIIIVIILAAAVILTLNKNNPVDSARIAQLVDNRSSLNNALTMYWTTEVAKSQGQLSTEQVILSSTDPIVSNAAGDVKKLTVNGTETDCYPVNKTNLEKALSLTLPTVSGATWYIEPVSGQFYLAYPKTTDFPNWMGEKDVNGYLLDTTLASFVRKLPA